MTFPQRRNTISPKQVKRHTQPLRGCLKSLHGFLQRYPHAMVIVDFRELRTIVTSSEAALHQLKTLMSGLFKQPLRPALGAFFWPWAAFASLYRLYTDVSSIIYLCRVSSGFWL